MSDVAAPVAATLTAGRRARAGWMLGALLVLAVLGAVAWTLRDRLLDQAAPATAANVGKPLAPATADIAEPSQSVSRETLRQQAERYPRDGRRWALLAYAEFEANAYAEAAAAFEKAVTVSPKVAADPGVLCDWADALGMAQGGTLKGRPTELLSQALALRSNYPKALEMAGSAAYEQRQFALAADYWRRLLVQMPDGSAGHRALAEGIVRAERLAAALR